MDNFKITSEELQYRLNLPLRDKIDLSCEKIEQWYNHWEGKVYVSFSGGKDSTVLWDIVKKRAFIENSENIPGVFLDTGLEFPEIREFVRQQSNVVWLKPRMHFKEVIKKYGYPVISKEQSRYLYEYHTSNSEKLKNIRLNGNKWNMGKISKKWKFLINAPFPISHMCCEKLKKSPIKIYEKQTGNKCILGTTIEESIMRKETYMRYGCNGFELNRPISSPLAFWTEKDIWEYIHIYNVPYSSIYDKGYTRTGCMFCMFGVNQEKEPNRFQKMKITHPKLYNYCINKLDLKTVLDYIDVKYE